MIDPMNPSDGTPIGGIREYEVWLAFARTLPERTEHTHTTVRIPAADQDAARKLGLAIADHITDSQLPDGGPAWSLVVSSVAVTDVDDTMSPSQLAADAGHWRRVVAALARKMPGLVMLSAAEYEAADPDSLVPAGLGDGMMVYLSPAEPRPVEQMLEPPAAPAEAPGFEPVMGPVPDDTQLPPVYGNHADPDVRMIAGHSLARADAGDLEIVVSNTWLPLELATIDHVTGEVHLVVAHQPVVAFPGHEMMVARPSTIEGETADLFAAAVQERQVLTATGWMTVETAEDMGPTADATKVMLVDPAGTEGRQTSFAHGAELLLRNKPPAWWSK